MFEIGKEYRRASEIHDVYNGQRQGGISTPSKHPFVFLFTSDSGEQHGYKDEFRPDGIFWYTGEGQVGDMKMKAGNKAILDHSRNGKTLHLFENTKKAHVRYIGTAICIGHHEEPRPDTNGYNRSAIVFHLDVDSTKPQKEASVNAALVNDTRPIKDLSLRELRDAATIGSSTTTKTTNRPREIFRRSQALKRYVLARSKGLCESCGNNAPFKTSKGQPFLECHHVNRLADGGPDEPENVIAICPNCHRRAHYSKDAKKYNEKMKVIAKKNESDFATIVATA